jgi:EAL domain-containing protein (putative c-di-GMP-specific phosphodiesterase class I)
MAPSRFTISRLSISAGTSLSASRRCCGGIIPFAAGNLKVAINLSPLQFNQDNLVPLIFNALTSAGLAPCRLELEITESVLLQNTQRTLATLGQLRELGIRLSMDDFGTGYSSLSTLRDYPFGKIKIDKSFVQGLDKDAQSSAIVKAIIVLAESLGMATTAEGVETREQFDSVNALGATEVQGFYVGRPQPVDQMANAMAAIARTLRPAA